MECKCYISDIKGDGVKELIDTLWNVNDFAWVTNYLETWINRYIMECKFSCIESYRIVWWELIDTLWNVNSNENFEPNGNEVELIDTLWNVNVDAIFNAVCLILN